MVGIQQITEEHKQYMSAFFTDFWKMVKASYETPDTENGDDYWKTLISWSDKLMHKYGSGRDPVVNCLVQAYLDGISKKQTEGK